MLPQALEPPPSPCLSLMETNKSQHGMLLVERQVWTALSTHPSNLTGGQAGSLWNPLIIPSPNC